MLTWYRIEEHYYNVTNKQISYDNYIFPKILRLYALCTDLRIIFPRKQCSVNNFIKTDPCPLYYNIIVLEQLF